MTDRTPESVQTLGGSESEDYGRHYYARDQLERIPQPTPLIDGVLTQNSYALLAGRDSTFKSYIALDMALCVATGTPYFGREVSQRPVLYVAAEGGAAMAARVRAWEHYHGIEVPRDMFTVLNRGFSFYKDSSHNEYLFLSNFVRQHGSGLVVIDTLRRVSGGADENGSAMGVVIDKIIDLKEAVPGCCVLVVAHTQKGDKDTRGFSGIEDDADTVWRTDLHTDRDGVTLLNTKSKYSETTASIHLRRRIVLNNMVLEHVTVPTRKVALPPRQKDVLQCLLTLGGSKLSVKQLSSGSRIAESTVAQALGELESKGLAEADRSARAHLWSVTTKGLDVADALSPDHAVRGTPDAGSFQEGSDADQA